MTDPIGFRTPPCDTDAEQALLGAILVNNEAYRQVGDFLRPEHFYETVHKKIFRYIARSISDGRHVDYVLLAKAFQDEHDLAELGGGKTYLAALARSAETILNAKDYGQHVHQLAVRRALIRLSEDAVNQAYDLNEGSQVNGQLTYLRNGLSVIEREAGGSSGPVLITVNDFVSGYQPQRPLVKAWDTKPGWLYSFTAPTGYAKTAIALCEAMNQSLAGRSVIYLAGENADDVRARVLLMQSKLAIKQMPETLRFVDRTFSVPEHIEAVRESVRIMGGADLIFVDTSPAFQAASGVEEENSNTEQLRWAMLLRQMTKFHGNPAVIALCHPTKRPQSIEESIPRGGGSFLAEVDGNYVSWLKADDGEQKFFDFTWIGKFRGSFEPVSYVVEIDSCDALVDPDGRSVRTAWAHRAEDYQVDRAAAAQTETENAMLKAMADYPGKSLSEWADLLGWKKYQAQRAVDKLYKDKLAQKHRNQYRLTKAGKDEAEVASGRIRRTAI